jgi:hypothetical protein
LAARPSAASKAGLDAVLTQLGDGNWRIVLRDDEGTDVYSGVYPNKETARTMARRWVLNNYNVETEEVDRPKSAPKHKRPRSLGPAPSHLVQMMRDRADDNEEKAIGARAQADALEAEAKRLREAADSLEGPDVQTEGP